VFGGRGSGAGGRGSGAGDRPCNGFVVGASAPGSLSDDRGLGAGDRPCNRDDGVLEAVVVAAADDGTRVIRFSDERLLASLGRTPLPPYIRAPLADPERYQTVYGIGEGSAAAPTAGLHFTPELLDRLRERGVGFTTLTLHVGLDTFRPVDEADPREHRIHQEYAAVPAETVAAIGAARAAGRRAIAVGTTTVRAIETAARQPMAPFEGWTDLFVLPGFSFRAVDALITNFHLPRSTLLMLVAAFAGKELIDRAYAEAIRQEYRFYSFGDAMLIL
ncbi:MAG: S-adenosylmethionine:tRNA ribosyltransferase-isomerase, partial [Chloroflexi bacterium]|nr:S-adenosylmethionine:tRNA ribosyltransferase-isomerase [Chloroflexota bacterium]